MFDMFLKCKYIYNKSFIIESTLTYLYYNYNKLNYVWNSMCLRFKTKI